MREQILQLLGTQATRSFGLNEILAALHIAAADKHEVKRTLRELAAEGRVIAGRGRSYRLAPRRPMLTGRLDVTAKGHAYVVPLREPGEDREARPDVFVERGDLETGIHGDIVEVALIGDRRGRPAGVVERVVERRKKTIVGRFLHQRRGGVVVPRSRKLDRLIFIPRQHTREEVRDDDWVAVEITDWTPAPESLIGRVREVLGREGEPGLDVLLIVRDHGVEPEFPPEVQAAAEALPRRIAKRDLAGRDDFRAWMTFTIDGATAKDFDDALSVERLEKGGWRLGVHIADVAHYVERGGVVDREARERGTSIYPIDRVVPMLPEGLSNDRCSLRPNEDRLTMSAVIDFDAQGRTVKHRVCNSVIHSNHRLTYEQVQKFFDGGAAQEVAEFADAHDALRSIKELSDQLRKIRFARGAIDLDVPETEVVCDERGLVTDVRRTQRLASHCLIEECMLLANEVVAAHLTQNDSPLPYRVHEPPDPARLANVAPLLALHGIVLPGMPAPHAPRQPQRPASRFVRGKQARRDTRRELKEQRKPALPPVDRRLLQKALDKAGKLPHGHILRYLILRAMMRAVYSPKNVGHFGLASECYCHFTSPIRRYPDLLVHRALKRLIAAGRPTEDARQKQLERLQVESAHASEREYRSERIERDCVKVKVLEFMRQFVGEEFAGWITGAHPGGLFVELERYPAEGMIRIADVGDDYYEYDEAAGALIGQNTGARFRFGDQIKVAIKHVDLINLELDLIPMDVLLSPPRKRRGRRG